MSYAISILRRAQKALANLPAEEYQKIRNTIRGLAADPRPAGCLKLAGRPGWRIRVGKYRVIYEIDDKSRGVTILDIGHRRDVYRD